MFGCGWARLPGCVALRPDRGMLLDNYRMSAHPASGQCGPHKLFTRFASRSKLPNHRPSPYPLQFESLLVVPAYGYSDVDEYYEDVSCWKDFKVGPTGGSRWRARAGRNLRCRALTQPHACTRGRHPAPTCVLCFAPSRTSTFPSSPSPTRMTHVSPRPNPLQTALCDL